jgi:5-hydroxyisourate hydrolase
VTLTYAKPEGGAAFMGSGVTDADGRLKSLMPSGVPLKPGRYELIFEVGSYFRGKGVDTFFPQVRIDFQVKNADEHYHVPLLLSPFGYSTYRGS